MTSTQANAETAQQLIERLESSSRDFVRDDIEETERNIRRMQTASSDVGNLSLGTIGGMVFQTFFPVGIFWSIILCRITDPL